MILGATYVQKPGYGIVEPRLDSMAHRLPSKCDREYGNERKQQLPLYGNKGEFHDFQWWSNVCVCGAGQPSTATSVVFERQVALTLHD